MFSAAVLAATHHVAGEVATAQPSPVEGKCPDTGRKKVFWGGRKVFFEELSN